MAVILIPFVQRGSVIQHPCPGLEMCPFPIVNIWSVAFTRGEYARTLGCCHCPMKAEERDFFRDSEVKRAQQKTQCALNSPVLCSGVW